MLPKLNVVIGADTKDFDRGITLAQKRMGAFTKAAKVGALAAVAAFAAASAGGFRFAKDLDKALAEVSTLIAGTPEEMDAIREAAVRMATEFGGSSAAQVRAFYQAISSGITDVTEATELLETANMLAKGGVTDITTSVDILTTAINAYAGSGMTAAQSSDILFAGVVAGKTTITELAAAMGRVAPMAFQMGVGFDDIVAATSALTKGGMTTAESVTGLRGVLRAILKPTDAAAKAAKEMGLEFNATALASKGLVAFLADVTDKTGGSAEAMSLLFTDTEGLIGVMSLASNEGKVFADVFNDVANSLGATAIASDKVADSLSSRLNVEITKMKERMTVLGGTLLEVIVPALERLNIFLDASSAAMKTLGANWDQAGRNLKAMMEQMKDSFNAFMVFLSEVPAKMKELGSNIIQGLLDGITAKWGDLKNKISELAEMLPEWMKDILDIQSPSKVFAKIGKNIMEGLIGGVVGKVKDLQESMKSVAGTIQTTMSSGFKSMIDGTKTVAQAFSDMARSIIAKLFEILVVQQIVGGFDSKTGTGSGLVGMIMKGIQSFEGGGSTGSGPRSGGIDGKGGRLAILHPQETVIDHTKGGRSSVGGSIVVNQTINVSTGVVATVRSEIMAIMPQIAEAGKVAIIEERKRGGAIARVF